MLSTSGMEHINRAFWKKANYAQHKMLMEADNMWLFSTFDSTLCISISNSVLNCSEVSD